LLATNIATAEIIVRKIPEDFLEFEGIRKNRISVGVMNI
jgi:hypothetical protein